jgi:hypothetical protein
MLPSLVMEMELVLLARMVWTGVICAAGEGRGCMCVEGRGLEVDQWERKQE